MQTCLKCYLTDIKLRTFQTYYFSILKNEKLLLSSRTFFRDFKTRYSLQGIDNDYLDYLSKNSRIILSHIKNDALADLYFDYFAKASIKHKETRNPRDLGSFFAKLVHTFRPSDYCALDNPIKNFFGLKKESFFISFNLISFAYKSWAAENNETIRELRKGFKFIDTENIIKHNSITDLKLIDLVYWTKANKQIQE